MPAITINTSEYELRRAREGLLGSFGALDGKRPDAWSVYGYPSEVTFGQLLTAYERGGPGHGAVHRILDKCWQELPRIKQPEADEPTPWETKLSKLIAGINGWQKLRDFDRRNMVGRYAGLIYRVADSKTLDQPLQRATKLVDLVPVYEDQLRVQSWNSDQASEDFGKVTMWQYRMRRPTAVDTQGAPDQWVNVHPSRIQILAEGSVGDFQDGVPLLKAGFNHLVDLEKISGGSAESFLKNSARTLVLKFEPNASPQVIAQNPDGTPTGQTVAEAIEEKTQALNRNQDASIVMQGGDASTLQTTVHDPEPSFLVAANLFAASVQIPFTVLFGQQTGRMASDEDKADMIARCKSRQVNELTPMLAELVTRLQAAGIADAGEFKIEWPALDAPGDVEKFDLLGKATAAMKTAFDAGLGQPLFDANELRRIVEYEEREDDGMPEEGDPGGDMLPEDEPEPMPPAQIPRE